LHKSGSNRIKNLILPNYLTFLLDPNIKKLYLDFRVIASFLKCLKYFKISSMNLFSFSARGIISQLWRIYILCIIKLVKPKIIITLIDDSPVFHWLSKNYKGPQFMAVQNGSRIKTQLMNVKEPYNIQHFFCFGNHDKENYEKMRFEVENYYPIGSLLASYYGNKKHSIKYDICLVSSWRGNLDNSIDVQMTMKSMKILDGFLSKYNNTRNVKIGIVLRSEPNSEHRDVPIYGDEKKYFETIYGKNIELIDPLFTQRNIYKVMDQSNIIISFGSTAAIEAFGFRKKVLLCDFTSTDLYNDYDQIILFKENNYNLFEEQLDRLRKIPQEEYEEKIVQYASYLMNYDPNKPTHLFIRQKIQSFLQ